MDTDCTCKMFFLRNALSRLSWLARSLRSQPSGPGVEMDAQSRVSSLVVAASEMAVYAVLQNTEFTEHGY